MPLQHVHDDGDDTPAGLDEYVPAIKRAIATAGIEEPADEEVKHVIADALADIVLYTGSVFGHELLVTARDATSNAPTEYATSEPLDLAEVAVVRAQAALTYFFRHVRALKISERIADEGSSWEYELSGPLLRDQLALLAKERDAALNEVLEQQQGAGLDRYVSFLAVRDRETSLLVEPYVHQLGVGGIEGDPRFGTIA